VTDIFCGKLFVLSSKQLYQSSCAGRKP
jgi:hypothetical protein